MNSSTTAYESEQLHLRSSAYPTNIFGHRSMSNTEIFDDLTIGDDIHFRIRFNREGPTAVDVKLGRSPAA